MVAVTATWLRQLREAVGFEDRYQYLLHDRDSIFAAHLDESVSRLGIVVLKSPPRCPKANAICERVIGTIRRECLEQTASRVPSRASSCVIGYLRTTEHVTTHFSAPEIGALIEASEGVCGLDSRKIPARLSASDGH